MLVLFALIAEHSLCMWRVVIEDYNGTGAGGGHDNDGNDYTRRMVWIKSNMQIYNTKTTRGT